MAENRQSQPAVHHDSHGNSVASWTAVGLIMIGFLVMSIAVVVKGLALFVIGVIVIVIGAIAGKVMSAMGFGVSGKPGS